jgi:hypothetical protein
MSYLLLNFSHAQLCVVTFPKRLTTCEAAEEAVILGREFRVKLCVDKIIGLVVHPTLKDLIQDYTLPRNLLQDTSTTVPRGMDEEGPRKSGIF